MLDVPVGEWLERAREERAALDRLIAWLEAAPVEGETPAEPELERVTPIRTAAAPGARDVEGKIMAALLHSNVALSQAQIAEKAKLDKAVIGDPLRRLVDGGRVIAEGKGRARRYRAAPQGEFHSAHRARTEAGKESPADVARRVNAVGLRSRVMTAIASDPNALTEQQLASDLGVGRDDVADAVGYLLIRDRVQLNPDGTYRRNGAKAVA